jgi:hypothetical protein
MDYEEDPGDEMMEEGDEYVMSVDDEEDGDNSAKDEIEMEQADESDSEADSEDEEISSDDDSATEDIKTYSQTGTDADDDSSEESEEDEEDSDAEADNQVEFGWDDVNAKEFLDGIVEEEGNEGGGILGQGESELDKGWTRIESSGFGGMLVGSRCNGRNAAAANLSGSIKRLHRCRGGHDRILA